MKSDTGALALDCEHGHAALSSTRFENVIVAMERQRHAVPIQFDIGGLRAAGDAEFPALTVRRNPKNVVEENGHPVEARPQLGRVRALLEVADFVGDVLEVTNAKFPALAQSLRKDVQRSG
jgi:hypothetical protein